MKDSGALTAESPSSPPSSGGAKKFGESMLKKYGWKEGDGIGKTNQGIVAPIKASFKFDQTGVGYNLSDEFTVNWWEHLFNHTAKKIDKATKKAQVAVQTAVKEEKEEEANSAEEKTASPEKAGVQLNSNKSFYYSRFTKGSLLVNGETVPTEKPAKEAVEPEEETYDKKGKKIVSDEELFKACGGRTAHKGARHGIKMNGKLARIEEQEKQLAEKLEKCLNGGGGAKAGHRRAAEAVEEGEDEDASEAQKTAEEAKKSKKKKRKSEKDDDVIEEPAEESYKISEEKTKKKKKKKRRDSSESI